MNTLAEYLLPFLQENALKHKLRSDEAIRVDVAPSVGPETGRLLTFLVRLLNAKNVLEIGTCQGYSALWLAEGLADTGGKLVAVEANSKIVEEARDNILTAGFDNVEFIVNDALLVIPHMQSASFDIIFQDSAKALYGNMLDDCVRLLRPGGVLVSDDILFKALGKRASIADAMHNYNKLLSKDTRLFTTFLSIGDGVALSMKIKE